ncbi:UNVERIFIED_ORG: methylated-DNA-[protein]-cysteine S-methyltransferase [Nocardia globerula]|uniref:Methylated-DNA--protein-cysteine methyltransferase n=1 Tax=Nocardia globerula TaxID=1818 RepID=A0A652YQM5_NOCGL|nr:methylated-DNA--[protein]-cysteine S-methyltransferase [Rhodococcus globerulus]NMD63594.1 methylated-DNA--[protein]-cysteine S-methyltransferase [Nocardia globerula]PVX63159.1 methylated-DNA-[protein]-cysteine S-methyltransferase [Rhodococcus globerulus]
MTTEADVFGALPASDPEALARLHSRLADAAAAAQLIDVAYRIVDSPIGKLLLAATDVGLVRVAFAVEGHDVVLGRLADTVSPRVLHHPRRLDAVARELDEYFAGARREFDLDLDFQLAKGFRREVLRQLPEIEYGHTASYSTVAAASGSPRAVRAVGTACAKNPLPLVVPCHRVVRSDGSLGQYAGGPELKAVLLDLESRQ